MCGRVACGLDTETLTRIARVNRMRNQIRYSPSYNIAPNRYVGAIYRNGIDFSENKELNEGENYKSDLEGRDESYPQQVQPSQNNHIKISTNMNKNKENDELEKMTNTKCNQNKLNKKSENQFKHNFHTAYDKQSEIINSNLDINKDSNNNSNKIKSNEIMPSLVENDLNSQISDNFSSYNLTSTYKNDNDKGSDHEIYSTDLNKNTVNANYSLEAMKWGTRTRDNFFVINARSETIPFTSFKNFKRCVLMIQGYYEWKQEKTTSQPYYIHLKETNYMLLAGLYKTTFDKDGFEEKEMVILTKSASEQIDFIHNRMPIILTEESIE
jgi:putative SOS response-associated peptidase YedK